MPTPNEDRQAERRDALDRALRSSQFRSSGRLSHFLRFAVESTLNGNGSSLKESVIGVEVFGRPADYDPRTDPVVRVEARRLRAKLLEYYHEEGALDPLRIQIPKGGYTPTFIAREKAVPHRWIWIAAAVAITALAAAFMLNRINAGGALDVAVLAASGAPPIADSLSEALTEELARDGTLRVLGWTAASRTRGDTEFGSQARSVVEITAAPDGALWRVTGHMMDAKTHQKQWVESYHVARSDWPARRRELAQSMAGNIRQRLASVQQRVE